MPPFLPPKSLPHQPFARISELDWVSQEHSLHTIPVTISNKARQGEGWDAPWHLNQLLSYNNSMIFNPSLLLSSLQYLKQHTGFYHDWEKHQQMNEFLNICPGIWAHLAEIGTLTLIELNAVMLLVLKFKQSSSSECQLFVNVSHRDLYLHTPCLTVCAKEKAQMCVNSQGLWMHVLSLASLREVVEVGGLPPWGERSRISCIVWKIYNITCVIYAKYSTTVRISSVS